MKFFVIFISIFLFAADLDFDGIEDSKDYCPKTPLLAIVDKHGCEIHKKLPFNYNIEIGENYIIPYNIPERYTKVGVFHKSYELSFYYSKVKLKDAFHSYTKLLDFSKKFFNSNGYYKLSFLYYPATYYNKQSKGIKFSVYLMDKDILAYYKFKNDKPKNIKTIFAEKILKYPKIIFIPFFYLENPSSTSKFIKYVGISSIVRLKVFYTKLIISKPFRKGVIISFSIGKNF